MRAELYLTPCHVQLKYKAELFIPHDRRSSSWGIPFELAPGYILLEAQPRVHDHKLQLAKRYQMATRQRLTNQPECSMSHMTCKLWIIENIKILEIIINCHDTSWLVTLPPPQGTDDGLQQGICDESR